MNTITIILPELVVTAYGKWLAKWKECKGMSTPAAFAMSIRMLTPTSDKDSRWNRSLTYRQPGHLTCAQILSRLHYWRRERPCQSYDVPLYPETYERMKAHAAVQGLTPEDYCARQITYHASLIGGREFEETVFDRFERALAKEFREEKANLTARAEASIEKGLTIVDLVPEIKDAA